jgi:NodT family efflux transporter outer membrane factor (OMF) lipoprotein
MSISVNRSRAAALLAVVLAAGCSLAPKFTKPEVSAPAAFQELPSQTSADGTTWKPSEPRDAAARGNWWELFGDAKLDEFEGRLSSSNQSVAAAAAAFLAARAQVAQARSQYFPTLGTAPGVTRSHVGATPYGSSLNNSFTEYSLPFDASWQPDFWGKTRSAVAASEFAAQASAADLENVRLTAHAELAVDYYQLRAQDALAVLLDSATDADRDSVSVTEALNRAGLDSDQALAQAQSSLEAARAQAADARILRAQYEHAIATLLGLSASSFTIVSEAFSARVPPFPIGIPSRLLERRPDIAAAERAVASANAQIGVARAAYFPSVTLSAAGGFESFSPSTWLSWPSRFWSIGAGASETLFDGGLRGALVGQAKAARDQTAAQYRQTVLSAFQQVEDDLASIRISSDDVRDQAAAVAASRRNFSEAQTRYQAGLDPYQDVLTAQTSLIALDQTLLSFQIQQVLAGVRLIEALGGGWDVATLPLPKELGRGRP